MKLFLIYAWQEYDKICKGGSGSGNFSHEGRPGEVGGSSKDEGNKVQDKPIEDSYHKVLIENGWKYVGKETLTPFLAKPIIVDKYIEIKSKKNKIIVYPDGNWFHRRGPKLYISGKNLEGLSSHLKQKVW